MEINFVLIIFCICSSLCSISSAHVGDSTARVIGACFLNGTKMVKYDNNTYECTGNRLVKRPIAQTTTSKTDRPHSAPSIATTQATVIPTATDVDVSDIFKCGSVPHTGRSSGYECCGNGKYRPAFDTCCVQMRYNFKVHTGKRHKDHVCCGMDAYLRNSIILCRHPARNDRLWKTKLKFMKIYKAKKYCSSDKHEYLMTVGTKDEQHNFQFYHANITKLDNGQSDATKQVKVAIDRFSPKRTLEEKSFFIISKNIYQTDFYLGSNDVVMRLPRKMRTFRKRFNKIQKKCTKPGNRSSRRKRRHRTKS